MPYKQRIELGSKVRSKENNVVYIIRSFNNKTGTYIGENKYYGEKELEEKGIVKTNI